MISTSHNQSAELIQQTSEYQVLKERLHHRLVSSLDLAAVEDIEDPAVAKEIQRLTWQIIKADSSSLPDRRQQQLYEDLQDELFRFGPLEVLLSDPTISDILVNGPHEVYIERDGQLSKSDVQFADGKHLLRIIQRIVGLVSRRLDRSNPLVDARLPDGSRVNAVIPPLSTDHAKISIRRFVRSNFDLDVLVQHGSMTEAIAEFLRAAVQGQISMLFSGGTGAGKTTLLSALSAAIPATERIVTIEDSAELVLQHPHVVSLETRPANQEGSGEYTLRDLVRNSLRMRPDRIIVGEVRGAEAIDMIQAMNTGHQGSMTTVHANGTADAFARLQLMIAMARVDLPLSSLREFIALAIPLVVHLERLQGGVRRVTRVSEFVRDDNGTVSVEDIFRFVPTGVADGKTQGHFSATGYSPSFLPRLRSQGLNVPNTLFEVSS